MSEVKRVLLTGAAGAVGTMLRPMLRARYQSLVLSDRIVCSGLQGNETDRPADLQNEAQMMTLCEGIDAIVHLGGYSIEGSWPQILDANLIGCRNLFEAARVNGVKRIVFASSNHAVGFYPRTTRIGVDQRVRPDSRYGVSKAFGEALGSFYADKFGLRVVSLRIGNVGEKPLDRRRLAIWLHPEDLMQLIQLSFEHPDIENEVFYGASHNERAWWDNSRAHALGYRPKHRAEDHVAEALAAQAKLPADPVGDFYQGGTFCSAEFAGDPEQLW